MKQLLLCCLTLALPALAPNPAATKEPTAIVWEVESSFRLFGDSQSADVDQLQKRIRDGASLEALYPELTSIITGDVFNSVRKRTNLFDSREPSGSDIRDRRYHDDYIFPLSYQIRARYQTDQATTCHWTLNSGNKREEISQPCGDLLRIRVPSDGNGRANATLSVTSPGIGTQSAEIAIIDRLIVGLGDSFASGEGNPDAPATFPNKVRLDTADRYGWLRDSKLQGQAKTAEWLDAPCSRSLLSQHVFAAFAYAARHPQEAVTLLELSCSGASIFDGLLVAQKSLPRGAGLGEATSQLQQLADSICESPSTTVLSFQVAGWVAARHGAPPTTRLLGCANPKRPIDAVLLSVGGNDIGFGGVVKWAMFPGRGRNPISDITFAVLNGDPFVGAICPAPYVGQPEELRCVGRPYARDILANDLPHAYAQLDYGLKALGVSSAQIVQTVYPDPTRNEVGDASCKFNRTYRPARVVAGMEALIGYIPAALRPRFELYPSFRQMSSIRQNVIAPLNETIRANGIKFGWTIVDEFADRTSTRGWCAISGKQDVAEMALPVWRKNSGDWDRHPSDFRAYSSQTRLFRTPNDAAITGYGGPDIGIQGAIHPTAELHAIIGDAVSISLDKVLASEPGGRQSNATARP